MCDRRKEVSLEYRVIGTAQQAAMHLDRLNAAKVMAVDIETTGLEPHLDKVRLIQIAIPNYPVLIFDCFSFLTDGRGILKTIFDSSSVKVFHNAKFDLKFLLANGIEVAHLFDTMLAAQLLRSSGGPTRAGLDAVCQHYINESMDKTEQKGDWTGALTSEQFAYAAKDAEILLRLREAMLPHIYKNGLANVAKIEFDCAIAIAQMEYTGIFIDLLRWQTLTHATEATQRQALDRLYEYSGRPTYQLTLWGEEIAVDDRNFNSNPFIKQLLKKNGIDVASTAKQHLLPHTAHPLVKALFDYRKSSKALSSFLYPIPNMINPKTRRLHPNYGQIGASSGRMSCGAPNIQQIPRDKAFRRCFVAPIGKKLIVADYSQIELRVAAQISGDRRMTEAYQNGEDLHTLTAALISRVPTSTVTKAQRQAAKAVNFGLIFGMGAVGLQTYAQQSYGVTMSMQQAEQFLNSFFNAYPGISRWHQQIRESKPTEERTLSGRKFTFHQSSGLSGLYNTPVQGTAADIVKAAVGILVERIKGTNIKIIAIVHDEIILEVDEYAANNASVLLKDVMELAGSRILTSIPCVAEVKIADDWAEK